ncbi:MAG: GspE/PulE family protein [Patescibacteria group bacterium]
MVIPQDELKKIIIDTGLTDDKGFAAIEVYAKNADIPLEDALVEKNLITDEKLGVLIGDHLKVPYISLQKVSIAPDAFNIVPERIARKQKVIAFEKSDQGIKLAMANPSNKLVIELLEKKTGSKMLPYLATDRDIYNTLYIYRKDLQKTIDTILKEVSAAHADFNDAPVEKMVDMIIKYANQDKTSDIHIEPQEKSSLIRFRIDGVLHDVLVLPKNLHDQIITRIKVLARLRTDEHLSAQDGKMRITLDEENLDIRVSILPIVEGEKVVMRLLSTHAKMFSLLDLGMSEKDLKTVTKAFSRSFGMILSTGPTGSGKSTSIYSILKILNIREKNITTVEDPVEYRLKGVNQIQVNVKTNLTFANGLRSILRQDPNIVFVGEIRDNETAGIAINAALTGHLVLSTLHTNDAATTLPRLIDMKIEPFLVASTINVIIAQRLIRRICEMCKSSYTVVRDQMVLNLGEETTKKHFGDKPELRIYKGAGCKICHFTGYAGRVGLFEVLEVTARLKKLILDKEESDVIGKAAVEDGMNTMLDDGLQKVIKGVTTIEEVLRATKVES